MSKKVISACYYPTRIILIDDNEPFLQNIETQLNIENITCSSFNTPSDFVKYFNEEYNIHPFSKTSFLWLEENDFDHRTIDINIREIYKTLFNNERFGEISIAISDYAMPDMNGLELFANLKEDYPLKRILLTAEADEKLAVQAFNDGLIDAFIRKDMQDFSKTLITTIYNLQSKYFNNLSHFIMTCLTQDPSNTSCLNDSIFVSFFEALSKKYTEYYLLDEFGSYLLMDFEGKPTWLAVKTEEEAESNYEIAKDFSETASVSPDLLETLRNRDKIIFLPPDINQNTILPSQWPKHAYPAKKIKGKKTYYYALIEDVCFSKQPDKRIVSYRKYLEE